MLNIYHETKGLYETKGLDHDSVGTLSGKFRRDPLKRFSIGDSGGNYKM